MLRIHPTRMKGPLMTYHLNGCPQNVGSTLVLEEACICVPHSTATVLHIVVVVFVKLPRGLWRIPNTIQIQTNQFGTDLVLPDIGRSIFLHFQKI